MDECSVDTFSNHSHIPLIGPPILQAGPRRIVLSTRDIGNAMLDALYQDSLPLSRKNKRLITLTVRAANGIGRLEEYLRDLEDAAVPQPSTEKRNTLATTPLIIGIKTPETVH